jgi:outer membrane lipoprotein SlyB
VNTTPAPQSASAGPYYGQGQAPQTYAPNNGSGGYNSGGGYNGSSGASNGGYTPVSASAGDGGRVVSINDVSLGGGGINGTAIGGILGGLGGVAIGLGTGGGLAGGLLGGLLGVMGGATAGSVYDQHRGGGSGRGVEVTVQRDDGSTVTVAQRDDGDIQLGDRVQVVQGRNGVARAVRDNSRTYDNSQSNPPAQYNPPPQYGDQQQYAPPPQDDRQSQYNPPSQDYGPRQGRGPGQGSVYPQSNPRYGTLQ